MGVPLRLARHSFCGDIEVNAVQSLLSPETTVMGHGGCRLLREALFRRCLYRVSGSCYLQPREEGHGLGWVQGSAGDSMRRVAARRALTAHLGHRPGTALVGLLGAVGAGTRVAPTAPAALSPPSATFRG